jgi:drug/metabolite transporter (DMT)-like permease
MRTKLKIPLSISTVSPRVPVTVKVAGYMLVSAACFSGSTAIIRHVSAEIDPIEIAFFRSLFGLVVLLPWLWSQGINALRTDRLQLHSLRALVGAVTMLSWFYGLSLIPLGQAVALSFTTPLFSMLAAVLLLRELVGLRRWAAAVVGFMGTVIILRPNLGEIEWGALLVLLCSMALAVNVVIVKVLSRSESPGTIVAYLGLFMVPTTFVPTVFVWQSPSVDQVLWLTLLGALATASNLCRVRALALGKASAVVPYDFARLPIVALVAYLVFAEVPDGWMWLGAAVIFSSALYISYQDIRGYVM